MNIGDVVKIESCASCPDVVGKTAKIKSFTSGLAGGEDAVELNFGRGRPMAGRPKFISRGDLTVVKE